MIIPVIIVGMQLAVTVQNHLPTIDVTPSCRAEASGSIGLKLDVESCLKTEQEARTQIGKEWGEFATADRSTCMGVSGVAGKSTYTELLTCLEMMRDARKLPQEKPTTIGRGPR